MTPLETAEKVFPKKQCIYPEGIGIAHLLQTAEDQTGVPAPVEEPNMMRLFDIVRETDVSLVESDGSSLLALEPVATPNRPTMLRAAVLSAAIIVGSAVVRGIAARSTANPK